ncbi:general transcription factor 3C polypeptide 3 [Caerostris extrusa]|uniref:General transcription factor 3C polypeptide 3 n=1 Tax=Caerostris extrusa TaxID=172846 RepID=A0AAV4MEW5_CAEEX|nr:general transcription factor 3C polypeptide 3 [Caerostris extrusa]
MEPQMKKRKTRMKRNVLPKRLGCLMGQANSHYANGDYEAAITICMELIKFAPHSYEPFQLLGVIYEEKGESRKAFQCNLVAAYLNSSDTDGWLRLAEISIERKEIHQAIKCYTKAIHNEPSNVGFLWERCNLYEQVGDRTRALYGYERILKNFCNPEDSVKCIEMARGISKIHHENGDCVNAAKVLDTAFSKFPSLVTSKDINYLLQLQLSQRMYKAAVKTFVQYCGVKLNMSSGNLLTTDSLNDADEESFKTLNSCIIPEELDLALTVKFLICLIHLKAFNAAQPLMDCLKQENPEKTGYFYLDVADALIEVQEYQEAKSFLFLLISTQSYNLPTVWMKYADCLHVLSNVQEAIQAYHKVLDLAPDVQQARLTLSKIFLAMGRRKEATDILKQKSEDGEFGITVGIDALYERCKLLEAQESWEEYISAASLLQYSHCYYLETEEEFNAAVSSQSFKNRKEILKDLKRQSKKSKPKFTGNQIPVSEMWSIFRKVLDKLMEKTL